MTVATLTLGAAVRSPAGSVGKVVSFDRDHAFILWSGGVLAVSYTDDDLRREGIVRVEMGAGVGR